MGLVFSPWLSLVTGYILQFLAGSTYLFGVYAGDLRSVWGISQSEVQLLGTLLNIGAWIGVTGGLVLDRLGRLATLGMGVGFLFIGYFGVFLASAGYAFSTSNFFPLWCVLFFVAGQGLSFLAMLGLKVNIENFSPSQRGQVVGLMQAAFAMSGGIFSLLRSAFFHSDVASLMLFLSVFCAAGALLVGVFVNVTRFTTWCDATVHRHFTLRMRLLYGMTVATALYVFLVALFKAVLPDAALQSLAVLAVVLVFSSGFLLINTGPLWGPRDEGVVEEKSIEPTTPQKTVVVVATVDETSPLVTSSSSSSSLPENKTSSSSSSLFPEDLSLFGLFQTPHFYLLWFTFFVCVGCAVAVVNNMFSLVISRSYSPLNAPIDPIPEADLLNQSYVATFVALFSSVNTIGRLLFGYLSDRLAHRIIRSFWLVLCAATMLSCHLSYLFATVIGFFPIIIFMGLAYGGLFAVVPALVADMYGPKNFGLFYGIFVAAPAAGSLIFSTVTAGGFADRFAPLQNVTVIGSDGDLTWQCIGAECYQFTFVVFISVVAIGLVVSIILWWTHRRALSYQRI